MFRKRVDCYVMLSDCYDDDDEINKELIRHHHQSIIVHC